MSFWDLRQAIESRLPWWIILVGFGVIVALAIQDQMGKRRMRRRTK